MIFCFVFMKPPLYETMSVSDLREKFRRSLFGSPDFSLNADALNGENLFCSFTISGVSHLIQRLIGLKLPHSNAEKESRKFTYNLTRKLSRFLFGLISPIKPQMKPDKSGNAQIVAPSFPLTIVVSGSGHHLALGFNPKW